MNLLRVVGETLISAGCSSLYTVCLGYTKDLMDHLSGRQAVDNNTGLFWEVIAIPIFLGIVTSKRESRLLTHAP